MYGYQLREVEGELLITPHSRVLEKLVAKAKQRDGIKSVIDEQHVLQVVYSKEEMTRVSKSKEVVYNVEDGDVMQFRVCTDVP
ncbi:hypothetical protein SPFM20_00175 [Salmonella phage SPFM20]|nr:hypothetical protein SPFM1_00184 [Salmonella phage SPFM1]VFR14839.1 hypothetical protein SPFM20_00175 [Salmonella phage SPFM20]